MAGLLCKEISKGTEKEENKTVSNSLQTYRKEGPLHVRLHVVVVQGHNLDESLKGSHLDDNRLALGGLADHLHDVVSLTLVVEVLPDELQRVVERRESCQPHLTYFMRRGGKDVSKTLKERERKRKCHSLGLVIAGAGDDSSENLVSLGSQDIGIL